MRGTQNTIETAHKAKKSTAFEIGHYSREGCNRASTVYMYMYKDMIVYSYMYMSRACCQVVASIWPIRAAPYQGVIILTSTRIDNTKHEGSLYI